MGKKYLSPSTCSNKKKMNRRSLNTDLNFIFEECKRRSAIAARGIFDNHPDLVQDLKNINDQLQQIFDSEAFRIGRPEARLSADRLCNRWQNKVLNSGAFDPCPLEKHVRLLIDEYDVHIPATNSDQAEISRLNDVIEVARVLQHTAIERSATYHKNLFYKRKYPTRQSISHTSNRHVFTDNNNINTHHSPTNGGRDADTFDDDIVNNNASSSGNSNANATTNTAYGSNNTPRSPIEEPPKRCHESDT